MSVPSWYSSTEAVPTVSSMAVGLISARIELFSFPRAYKTIKHGVESNYSIRNVSIIEQRVGNGVC